MDTHDYVLVVERNLQEVAEDDYLAALRDAGYRLEVIPPGKDPVPMMQARPPIAAIFQFDFPDQQGLADLRQAKQDMASVPLLMITQAHSEHLAVWAFRSRVWDYFVHPVDLTRLLEVMATLRRVRLPARDGKDSRQALDIRNTIPPEARLRFTHQGSDQTQLERAISFVDQNLHRKIAQAEVADQCGLSTFQFSRLFKRMTGNTFQEYLVHRRIAEAMRLLANPKVSITDVCFTVGFRDLSYFTRTFQRYVGKTPSRYRLGIVPTASAPINSRDTANDTDLTEAIFTPPLKKG